MTDASGRRLREMAVYLGEATNNVAETCALILALQAALQMGRTCVLVRTDSELLARQVSGEYRVKDRSLQWLHALIRNLREGFDSFDIRHVPREQNRKADRLANRAVLEGVRKGAARRRTAPAPAENPPETQPTLF